MTVSAVCSARRVALVLTAAALTACGSADGRSTSTTAPAPVPAKSGIAGRVVAGPTCPVERVPPDPRCAPRPLAATLRIRRAGAGGRGATVRAAGNGRFRVALAPGTYVVTALPRAGSPLPRPPAPINVRVRSGRYTAVTITYDTGIR